MRLCLFMFCVYLFIYLSKAVQTTVLLFVLAFIIGSATGQLFNNHRGRKYIPEIFIDKLIIYYEGTLMKTGICYMYIKNLFSKN